MNLTLLANRMLVTEIPSAATGRIVTPQNARPQFGPKVFRVEQVGPKVKEVRVGERVLAYSPNDGPRDIGDGRKLITEDQVLAVIGSGG